MPSWGTDSRAARGCLATAGETRRMAVGGPGQVWQSHHGSSVRAWPPLSGGSMAFESVRGYVQLASGLGELTRARALEAAQGLLALPGMAGTTGKVAGQVGALAEEILAAAFANRENLTALVRGEVDVAVSRLGLVPAADLEGARDEVARLRAEVSRLREATAVGQQEGAGAG